MDKKRLLKEALEVIILNSKGVLEELHDTTFYEKAELACEILGEALCTYEENKNG